MDSKKLNKENPAADLKKKVNFNKFSKVRYSKVKVAVRCLFQS